MSKELYKKMTLQELIAKKEQRLAAKKKGKQADVYVASLGAVITIKAPDLATMQDAVKMDENGDSYLVYQCCVDPNLKSSELLEAYEVMDPPEIVSTIFEPGEISPIAMECLKLAGYGDKNVRLVDATKN